MFDEPAERRAIFELGKALQDAWNRGDAAGYGALFTDDADFVAWTGAHGRGRQVIEDAHRRLFDGPLAGSGWFWSMTTRKPQHPSRCGSSARMRPSWSSRVS